MQHGTAAGLARLRSISIIREHMNFITNGANSIRAKAIRAALPHHRQPAGPSEPYAFLSARDLRGLVAAMVD